VAQAAHHSAEAEPDVDASATAKRAPLTTKMFQASDDLSLIVVASKPEKSLATVRSASEI
jgi:hypothetical protein|tara:strand:- start:142 stop:321 length:180 start_codon:yes stop_codon:yes gene_type:complete